MRFEERIHATPAWWRGRVVAVTGATGFIGRHLISALRSLGAEIHALARRPEAQGGLGYTAHRWSLEEIDGGLAVLREVRPHVVFHGAVHRGCDPASVEPLGQSGLDDALRITTEGGRRLLMACRSADVQKVVVLGSSSEYGPHPTALREDMQDNAVSEHGASKAALTKAMREMAKEGLNAVSLRIFYAYGHGDDPRRFIPTVIRAARTNDLIRLTPRGFVRDYVHVDDVVTACLRAGALNLRPGEVINAGTGVGTDNHDVVAMVQSLCGGRPTNVRADFPPRPADHSEWRADVQRMRTRLGLTETIEVKAGLARLVRESFAFAPPALE